MSTVFPQWTNRIPAMLAGGAAFGLLFVVWAGWYYLTPDFFEVGYAPEQPVLFSHQIHAGQLGMDCRYCHSEVEKSYHANVPATATCMNCHTVANQISGYLRQAVSADGTSPSAHWQSPHLRLVRASFDSGKPIEWRRIHKVPDYAHFPHAAHINAGVSCYSCHGRIDEMPVVHQVEGLGMGWCLDCHRNPEKHLIDTTEVRITDLRTVEQILADRTYADTQGQRLKDHLAAYPPQHCGACHY